MSTQQGEVAVEPAPRQPDTIERMLRGESRVGFGRAARVAWVAVWLVFLGYPISDIVSGRYSQARTTVAWIALALFVVLYLRAQWIAMGADLRFEDRVDLRPYVALMAVSLLSIVMFGGAWGGLVIYLGVATGSVLSLPKAVVVLGLLAVFEVVGGLVTKHTVADVAFAAFLEVGLGMTMILFRRVILLVVDLRAAREEVARLAVAEERLRFSRDLHDVMGHSLSVIALQSQVARRLMVQDPVAAGVALSELEGVAQESLGAVRDMVTGYRQRSLGEEISGAREVLGAAGIRLDVDDTATGLPADRDGLLAWAVREGVTNVLRHSRARTCRIAIDADDAAIRLEVADDGVGGTESAGGSGLRGLRERMAEVGGTLDAGPGPGGGFRLRVRLPSAT